MVGSHPALGRNVGEVAGVAITICQPTGLLAETDGFGGGTEEVGEVGLVDEGGVGAVGVEGGEGHAVLEVGADDGGDGGGEIGEGAGGVVLEDGGVVWDGFEEEGG